MLRRWPRIAARRVRGNGPPPTHRARLAALTLAWGVLATAALGQSASGALRIARIASDQFPGVTANFLPPDPSSGQGAGNAGNRRRYLLMGERAGQGRVRVRLGMDPPEARPEAPVRVGLTSLDRPAQPIESIAVPWTDPAPEVSLAVALDAALPVNRFDVQAWIDLDGDGQLTPANGETPAASPGEFWIVSLAAYQRDWDQLMQASDLFTGRGSNTLAGISLTPGSLPIAGDLLRSFLTGEPPQLSTAPPAQRTLCASDALSHSVGVRFEPSGCGVVPEYLFASDSTLSQTVLTSEALGRLIRTLVAANRAPLRDTFSTSTVDRVDLPLGTLNAKTGRREAAVTFESEADLDLTFAFHGATLVDPVVTVARASLDSVRLQGTLSDLYDFDYQAPLGNLGATIQAGFGTLGDGGGVFYLSAELNGPVPAVPHTGVPLLRLERVANANPPTFQLAIAGLPGTVATLEVSRDLLRWNPVNTLTLTATPTTVPLAPDTNAPTAAYYRVQAPPR